MPPRQPGGTGFGTGSLQARRAAPATGLVLGLSSVVAFRGGARTLMGWRSRGTASAGELGCCVRTVGFCWVTQEHQGWPLPLGWAFWASPKKKENPRLETFQSCHELSWLPSPTLPVPPPARPQNWGVLVPRCLGHLYVTSNTAALSATSSIPHSAALQPVFTEQ